MGYYINETKQGGMDCLGKSEALIEDEGAIKLDKAPSVFPKDKAVICVVNNGFFEAAAFCYDEKEMNEFNNPSDHRSKCWLLMDLERAKKLSGFHK